MGNIAVLSDDEVQALQTARDRLTAKVRDLEEAIQQKAEVEKTLAGITALLEHNGSQPRRKAVVLREMGLRDSIRFVLRQEAKGLASAQIAAEIERRGLDKMSESKHPLIDRVQGEASRMRRYGFLSKAGKKYRLPKERQPS